MRHPPLVSGNPDLSILEMIVPPELHLMLGIVDKLVSELEKNAFDGNEGKKFMSAFFNKVKMVNTISLLHLILYFRKI